MSKIYMEHHDPTQNSHRFYEVWVEGNITKTRHGRIGKNGKTHDYPNSSPSSAQLKRDELIAEKTRKGYRPVSPSTAANVPESPAPQVTNGYRLYWKTVSPITPLVLDKAVQETHEILRAIKERIGGAGWKLAVTEGVGGNAYTFRYGKATGRAFSFGFIPKEQFAGLKSSVQEAHNRQGIAGWLSPEGISPLGGDIQTGGDLVDLAARLLLVLLRGAVPDLTVTCDLELTYGQRTIAAVPDEHAASFAWTQHWETIASVLAELGMVRGSAGIDAHLRKLSRQSAEPFVF